MNPVILIALIVQGVISKSSHAAGAFVGFLITTGILFWGLSVYSAGNVITLFGVPLSLPVFLGACLLWYLFDIRELRKGPAPEGEAAE